MPEAGAARAAPASLFLVTNDTSKANRRAPVTSSIFPQDLTQKYEAGIGKCQLLISDALPVASQKAPEQGKRPTCPSRTTCGHLQRKGCAGSRPKLAAVRDEMACGRGQGVEDRLRFAGMQQTKR